MAIATGTALLGSALLGGAAAVKGSRDAKKSAEEQQRAAIEAAKMDPRNEAMLYGSGADKGLLSQWRDLGNQPQSEASKAFAGANADYLTQYGGQDMGAIRQSATGLMKGSSAPTASAVATTLPAYLTPTKVDAPSQNGMDLSGSYNSLINGAPGSNPYLTGAIQKGINQSSNAFGAMVEDAKAATHDMLGSVRSNSVLSGQFGGSRQGIAEGRALESMNTQLGRAASHFGQNNTDAAVAAQAGAYNTDRDRQLAATQGLGAQQYGVAQQNAAMKQQADALNVNNLYDATKTNAGLLQQTQLANQGAQLQTNAQNNAAALGGAGLLGGLTGQAAGVTNAQDNYGLNKAQAVNGLLGPYLTRPGNAPVAQPIHSNTAGNVLGGAMAGLGLYNQFKQAGTQPYGGAIGNPNQPYGSNGVF